MTYALVWLVGLVCGWACGRYAGGWTTRDAVDHVDLTAERRTLLMDAEHRQHVGK